VLKRAAIAYQLVPPGQHLFKFYQGPGDWRKSDTVLNLAKDAPFMFDIDEVRRKLSGASTYLQISDVLRKYK